MNEPIPGHLVYGFTKSEEDKKGLYEKDVITVTCPSCKRHCVDIKTVDDQPIFLKHIIVCPFCDEESFIYKTEGSYIYDLPDNVCAKDIVYEEKDQVKLFLGSKNAR